MYKKILATAVLALSFLGTSAHAITIETSCSISDVTTSTACIGRVTDPQNDQPDTLLATEAFFGINDWVRVQKSDEANNPLFNLSITGDNTTSGTWNVTSFGGATAVTLVVKAADNWAAYLLDIANLSGNWSTAALLNNGNNQPEISHISLYVGTAGPVSVGPPVPLPGALPLFGTGLAIMGFIGWRRKWIAVA